MAILDDLLGSIGIGNGGGGDPGPAAPSSMAQAPMTVDPQGNPVDPNAPTQMDELVGTIAPKPKAPDRVNYYNPNYDNSDAVQQTRDAETKDAAVPQHDHNAGLFGLLPQSARRGTLRDILGHLGDAFLTQAGKDPIYQPRADREAMGDAMAGFQQDYGAAASRLAATGRPGALDMADKVNNQGQMAELRKQMQAQQFQYHQDTNDYHKESVVQRMAPTIAGWAQGITDPNIYSQVYAKADAAAKRIDPSYDASVFGYIDPAQWRPGAMDGVGATTGQILHNNTSKLSIGERQQAALQNHQDRVRGQNLTQSRYQQTATTRAFDIINKHRNGTPTTPDEDNFLNTYINGKGKHSRGLINPSSSPASSSAPQRQQQFQDNHTYTDKNGNSAVYRGGHWFDPKTGKQIA